jgi:hypothetical protein
MIVKAPSALKWDDVVDVLTLIFDFKGNVWDSLRKGSIHAVVDVGTET